MIRKKHTSTRARGSMGFGVNLCFWKPKLFLRTEVIFNNWEVRGWVGLSQLKEIHVKVKILIVRTLLVLWSTILCSCPVGTVDLFFLDSQIRKPFPSSAQILKEFTAYKYLNFWISSFLIRGQSGSGQGAQSDQVTVVPHSPNRHSHAQLMLILAWICRR